MHEIALDFKNSPARYGGRAIAEIDLLQFFKFNRFIPSRTFFTPGRKIRQSFLIYCRVRAALRDYFAAP
jgi:hypothetical protein